MAATYVRCCVPFAIGLCTAHQHKIFVQDLGHTAVVFRSLQIRQLQDDKSDLERQVTELSSKCEQIKPREAERWESFTSVMGFAVAKSSSNRMPTQPIVIQIVLKRAGGRSALHSCHT